MTIRTTIAGLTIAACTVGIPGNAHCASPSTASPLPAAAHLFPLIAQMGIREFGAIIDTRRPGTHGHTVLAVTPGSVAERMELRPGDIIVSVNNQSLVDVSRPSALLRAATQEDASWPTLKILRDDKPLTLSMPADDPDKKAVDMHDATVEDVGCGYISVAGAPPRNTQNVYPVEILNIDGNSTPASIKPNRHRMGAGRHVLIVRELIDDHRFTPLTLKERQRQLNQPLGRSQAYKIMIMDVAPNTRYEIGAKLLTTSPNFLEVRRNEYWEPVVWKEVREACR